MRFLYDFECFVPSPRHTDKPVPGNEQIGERKIVSIRSGSAAEDVWYQSGVHQVKSTSNAAIHSTFVTTKRCDGEHRGCTRR